MGYGFNTFDGLASGTNLSVANSGGANGAASDTIVVNNAAANGGNSAVQVSSAAAMEGANGLRITLAAATSYVRWTDPTPGARGGLRRSFHYTAQPTAQLDVASIRSEGGGPLGDSAGASMCALVVTSTGRVMLAPAGTNLAASAFDLTVGQKYWFEMFAQKGTTTTDGQAWLYVYAADGTTLLHSYHATGVNTRSSNAWQFRFGGGTNSGGYTVDDMDSIQFGSKETGGFGPLVLAPVIESVAITTTGEPGSAATATATLSSSSPVPDSWTWTQTAGPTVALSGTGATRTFTIPYVMPAAGETITLSATAVKGATSDTKSASTTALCHTFWTRMPGEDYRPVLF